MKKKINIVIADDHKIFRKGIVAALSVYDQLEVIGEAENGLQLLEKVAALQPDVVLVDVKMPEMDGIEALKKLKTDYPDVKVVMLTMYDDDAHIQNLMELGANSYLAKDTDADEIRIAIISVFESGYYFNDKVSKALLKRVAGSISFKDNLFNKIELNERETSVLKLICKEFTTTEIANELFLSPRTIDGIRASLIEKIQVKNTAGLVLYAVRNGYC